MLYAVILCNSDDENSDSIIISVTTAIHIQTALVSHSVYKTCSHKDQGYEIQDMFLQQMLIYSILCIQYKVAVTVLL